MRPFALLAALALLAGCTAAPLTGGGGVNEALTAPYQLDSGDQLRVTVYDQAELTNTYQVDPSGYVTLPLIGPVPARGRTTQEIAGAIAAALQSGFLRAPNVAVEIAQFRPFFIMGEVRSPGQYSYVAGMTAEMAVAIAGGFTPRANESSVEISRTINGEVLRGRIAILDAVRPGDTVTVSQRLL